MCGRYAQALRPAEVRSALQRDGMNVSQAPDDDDSDASRPTYNLAPSNPGLVYLAHTDPLQSYPKQPKDKELSSLHKDSVSIKIDEASKVKYRLQTMKWGLIPSWTKRTPDYATLSKTINCRDDSLAENKSIWNSMKTSKRCMVVAQGYYEWLKGKQKIPHYIKRKDGKLLCFAGLYDCVQYNGQDKLYTYTVITTDSNDQLRFLHHRMPVILENGSQELFTWLDPSRKTWSEDLQNLLRPFGEELEVYPVKKDVGKVGNDSPSFVIPVSSSENKSNIANYFPKSMKKDNTKLSITRVQEEHLNLKIESSPADLATSLKPESAPNEYKDARKNSVLRLEDDEDAGYSRLLDETIEVSRKRKYQETLNDEQHGRINHTNKKFSTDLVCQTSSQKMISATSNNTPCPLVLNKNKVHIKITEFFRK